MKHILVSAIILFFLYTSTIHAVILLKGELVTDEDRTVPATRIAVSGGPSDVTDDNGKFQISLPEDFIEGEMVIISVFKKGWVINYPLDGEWNLPNIKYQHVHTTKVIIVPHGSKALWSHSRIEKYISKLSDELAKIKGEDDQSKTVDFSYFLIEWASQYGFTPDQVKTQFDQWAVDVKDSSDYRALGLREFYLKNFPRASEYFTSAALQGETRRKALKERLRREDLSTYENWKDAGNSLYAAYKFRDALDKYRRAEAIASFESYPQHWAEIRILIGNTQAELGSRIGGAESRSLLSDAVASFQEALRVFTYKDFPHDWAKTQNNLGSVLREKSIRTGGEEGVLLLGQAVDAYQKALEVRTREDLPQDWAMSQNNLGNALREKGIRTSGDEGVLLLNQAVDAYRKALEVRTRDILPQKWAATQNNLGTALKEQSIRTGSEPAARLLCQAVDAYQNALEVYSREDLPQQWAGTQNNLGNALGEQGIRTGGEAGARLLGLAVEAYQKALEVYTKEELPQQWAATHNNLGLVFQAQGIRTGGEQGTQLLSQAVKAYRKALEVYTLENESYYWVRVQNSLAKLYESQENWNAAIECYQQVYKVYPVIAASKLAELYHNRVFRFDKALEMNLYLVNREEPYAESMLRLVENYFTAGYYSEGNQYIDAFKSALVDSSLSEVFIIFQIFEIDNFVGLNQDAAASLRLVKLINLIGEQAPDYKVEWNFTGSKYYVSDNEALAHYRVWLMSFFAALEKDNRDDILAALKKLPQTQKK